MLVRRACLRLRGAHAGAARMLESVQRACGCGVHAGAARLRVRRACGCGTHAQECAALKLMRRACVKVMCEAQACTYALRMRVLTQVTRACLCKAERMRARRACECGAHADATCKHKRACVTRTSVGMRRA
eukprot:4765770-Pleurochrysis_carterae.AAC.1